MWAPVKDFLASRNLSFKYAAEIAEEKFSPVSKEEWAAR
jgi:hypothetical protein